MSVRHVRIGCTFVQVAQIDTPTVFQVEPVLGQIAEIDRVRSGASSPRSPPAATPICTGTGAAG